MHSTLRLFVLLVILIVNTQALPSLKCLTYLLELKTLYETNKGLCNFCLIQLWKRWRPSCFSRENRRMIWVFPRCAVTTAWSTQPLSWTLSWQINMWLNIRSSCSIFIMASALPMYAQWVTSTREEVYFYVNAEFVIEKLFEDMPVKIQGISFYDAELDSEFSTSSVIILIVFGVWMVLGMVGLFSKWVSQCQGKE